MRDFTFNTHKRLLESLQVKDYSFITFSEYLTKKHPANFVILRHDVEQCYENALKFAQIQNQLGIKGSYYFRILPNSFNPKIVKQIADLGHEVGYHYDDLAQCKGDHKKALLRFEKNLKLLREIAPVQTICMDGSPLSKYDNKDLWKREGGKGRKGDVETRRRREGETERQGDKEKMIRRCGETVRQGAVIDNENTSPSPSVSQSLQSQKSFQDFGIIGEPYFNIVFNKVFYLTDTGRRWDGWKTSVRDKVPQQEEWIKQGLIFKTTQDIINAAHQGKLPHKIMFTFHPQRWTDNWFLWTKELVLQNVKNQVKMFLVKK